MGEYDCSLLASAEARPRDPESDVLLGEFLLDEPELLVLLGLEPVVRGREGVLSR
jgi:hypothetical protein